jgi:hypothetical protein
LDRTTDPANPAAPGFSRTLSILRRENASYVSPQVEGHEWTPAVGKLDEPKHTADPVHLMRVFGISASTAMKYVYTGHPERKSTLPR